MNWVYHQYRIMGIINVPNKYIVQRKKIGYWNKWRTILVTEDKDRAIRMVEEENTRDWAQNIWNTEGQKLKRLL